jgi:autotransporter-associated beta strand protein
VAWARDIARKIAAVFVAACVFAPMAAAQSTIWDATLSNSSWYVPVPYLISYISNNKSFVVPGPTALGDQTLWTIGTSTNGAFSGTSNTSLSNGLITSSSETLMQGVVTDSGQILIQFSPTDGQGITTVGVGQMRSVGGETLMEMQMTTGGSLLLTHWAYMAPYNPSTFTPPAPTQVITADVLSPQWQWTKGTTWRLVSQELFGSSTPGTFKISDYNSGYFWGQGVGPDGSPIGNFTQIGSITPEGNVLFSLLGADGALTNLTGQITGDGTTGSIVLHQYVTSGLFGTGAAASLVTAATGITAGMTFFASDLGSTVTPAFAGGTLQIDAAATYAQNFTLDDSGSNTIDQRGRIANFSGVFSDAAPGVPGGLIIANSESSGAIVLSGANTYTGPTTVQAGATLAVNGSIVSPVTVSGTLRGTGLIGGATTIASGGTLAPGNSPGTLTFAAPVTLSAGAVLQLDIDGTGTGSGAGNFSRVLVTGAGNGFAASGTLAPLLRGITGSATNSFTPSLGQQFVVVGAEGGVTGRFTGLAQPAGLAPGTRFDALYGANTVTLAVTPAAYGDLAAAGIATTPSQSAMGRGLDAIRPPAGAGLDGAAATLFTPLFGLQGGDIAAALDQLAPTIYGDAMLAARGAWYGFRDQVAGQLAGRRAGCNVCDETPGPFGSRLWVSGLAQYSTVASGDAPGFQTAQTGAIAGIDLPVGDGLLGVALGGGGLRSMASNGAVADGNMVHLALYGAIERGALFISGQAAYTLIDQSLTRPMGAWGTTTRGSASLQAAGGDLSAAWRLAMGDWSIEPTASLGVVSLSSSAATEQAAALAQQVAEQSLTSVRSLLAAPFGHRFDWGEHSVGLRGSLGWAHEFADTAVTTNAAFGFAPNAPFSVTTASIDRDQLALGLSADFTLRQGVAITAGYEALLGARSSTHGLRAGLRVTW